MPRRREPIWLNRAVVDAIHTDQVREHGGLAGLRDDNALESALASPRQAWHHDNAVAPASLAARYACRLVRNHPYRDGNKRTGFLAMVTFLGLNRFDFEASDAEVVTQMLALADGRVTEPQMAAWIRAHIAKLRS